MRYSKNTKMKSNEREHFYVQNKAEQKIHTEIKIMAIFVFDLLLSIYPISIAAMYNIISILLDNYGRIWYN